MLSGIAIHIEKKDLVYTRALEFVINRLKLYHNIRQKTLFLLSGGSTVNIYKDITKFIDESGLDFPFLAFAQVDERYFGKISKSKFQISNKFQNPNFKFQKEDINAYQIEKTGLWELCKKKGIPYYLISQAGSLQESAEGYNKILEKLFQEYNYKIAILGIGEDGHTAGLLPGYQKLWDIDKLVAGYENDGEFKRRISMTPEAFKQVDQAIVVASGTRKRKVIMNLLDNKLDPGLDSFPTLIIRKIQKSDLFTDIGNLSKE